MTVRSWVFQGLSVCLLALAGAGCSSPGEAEMVPNPPDAGPAMDGPGNGPGDGSPGDGGTAHPDAGDPRPDATMPGPDSGVPVDAAQPPTDGASPQDAAQPPADAGLDAGTAVDGGPHDTGTADTGTADTGTADTGVRDSGTPDAPGIDAGPPLPCTATSCAGGQVCCPATGLCYDPRCLACCMPRADAGPGPCTDNSTCAPSSYCAGTGCGTAGTCTVRPGLCPLIVFPVCGCNGTTYNNSCLAEVAGVRVASTGRCAPTVDAGPGLCGGVPCATGFACCAATGHCYDTRCLACCPAVP